MPLNKLHCIHLENGRFSPNTDTQANDIESLLDAFAGGNYPSGLAIHFHGGLVSYDSCKEIAERLTPRYLTAGTYPVFFVWESGAIETISNNLGDIAQEAIFRELTRKVLEFALGKLGEVVGVKGTAAPAVETIEVAHVIDDWFTGKIVKPPYSDYSLRSGKGCLSRRLCLRDGNSGKPSSRSQVYFYSRFHF